MIDFNNPTVVSISITSDAADFQLGGPLGWQAKVALSYLPPYDTTQEQVADEIASIIRNVGIVPYDNLAIMEKLRDRVEKLKAVAVTKAAATLKEKSAVTFKYSESDGTLNLLTVEVHVTQREDSPATSAYINKHG